MRFEEYLAKPDNSRERQGSAEQAALCNDITDMERNALKHRKDTCGSTSHETARQHLPRLQIVGDDRPTGNGGDRGSSQLDKIRLAQDLKFSQETIRREEIIKTDRDNLKKVADHKLSPEQTKRFETYMAKFEMRAAGQTPQMKPEEIARTYREVAKLIDPKDNPNPVLAERDRIKLAELVMYHVANPTSVAQGFHNTCSAASTESRLYAKYPAEAAQLVTEVATTGKFTPKDGSPKISIDKSVLEQDNEARRAQPGKPLRDYASQVFQGTAMALVRNGYYQSEPKLFRNPPDTGERYRDDSGGEIRVDWPTPREVHRMQRKIAGEDKSEPIIENHYLRDDAGTLPLLKDGQTHVSNVQELRTKLSELKTQGRLPAQMLVHTAHEPFFGDSGGGEAGGSGGWHFVTVMDYDDRIGKAKIDNFWGKRADHIEDGGIPVSDLYKATTIPTKNSRGSKGK